MNVGENITLRMKELRKQHQLSLQQVADRAGTTKSHIWEMENGRSKNPTVEMAVSIANAFGVSLEYLTGLSSAMPDLHPEAMQVAFEIDAILRKVGCTTDQKDGIETAAKWHESEAEHYEAHAGDKDGIPFPIVAGWHRLNAERIRALAPADAGKVEGDEWRPIETAPKDGTVIQVWHQVHKCPISVLWKDDGFPYRGKRLNWYERTYTTAWPEHVFFYWRHLPSAPSEGAK